MSAAADESRFDHHPAGASLLRLNLRGRERQTQQQPAPLIAMGRIPRLRMNRPVEAETAARVRNRNVGLNVMRERMERPAVLDRRGCPASRAGRKPSAAPPAEGTASVWSSVSKRRSTVDGGRIARSLAARGRAVV